MKREYSVEKELLYYKDSPSDRRAIPYDNLTPYISASFGLDFFRGKSVLDIGCGEGTYAAWFADIGGASEVLGIELTENRLRTDYLSKLPNLHLRAADIFAFQPPKQYDVVFMNLVLHHLRFRLSETCQAIAKNLAPGGSFAAIEPNFYNIPSLLLHKMGSRSDNEGFISPRGVAKALRAAGMEETKVGFFWRDRKWARNPLLGSCFWITARKPTAQH